MKPPSPFAYAPSLEASSEVMLKAWQDLADDIQMALDDYTKRTKTRVLSFALGFDIVEARDPVTQKDVKMFVYRVNPIVCRP